MIECILISAGTVFAVLGIIQAIRRIHQAIFIDRVPKWLLESAQSDVKRVERWSQERGVEIAKLCDELAFLKRQKRK